MFYQLKHTFCIKYFFKNFVVKAKITLRTVAASALRSSRLPCL